MNDGLPPDPFVPDGTEELAKTLVTLYGALVQAGLPEPRAYDLTRDFFLSQMVQASKAP